MSVHRLDDPTSQRAVGQWYFACPRCGWCSPLKQTHREAAASGRRHKARKAAKVA